MNTHIANQDAEEQNIHRNEILRASLSEMNKRMRSYSVGAGGLVIRKYGTAHALMGISESCGLRSDLREAYGNDGDMILACAISLVQCSAYPTTLAETMSENISTDVLGATGLLTPDGISDFCNEIGGRTDDLRKLFRLRIARASNVYIYDRSSIVLKGEEDASTISIGVDENGMPVHFSVDAGIQTEEDELYSLGASECIHIFEMPMDDKTQILDTLLLRDGSRFVSAIPASAYHAIMNGTESPDEHIIRRDGVNYIVSSESVEFADGRLIRDDEVSQSTASGAGDLVAWNYHREGEDSEDPSRVMARISVIERRLRKIAPEEAIRQFRTIAGRYARFFDISMVDGAISISVRWDDLDQYLQRYHTVITRGFDTWEEAMDCLEGRRPLEIGVEQFGRNLTDSPHGTATTAFRGEAVIHFVALTLWCEISDRLTNTGHDEPVPRIIRWLDTILAKGNGAEWHITGITPRTRSLLLALDTPMPKDHVLNTGRTSATTHRVSFIEASPRNRGLAFPMMRKPSAS